MRKLVLLLLILLLLMPSTGCLPSWNDAQQSEIGVYVGSINSTIYHCPSCEWAQEISPQNKMWFESVQDAKNRGYRPCKVCNPPAPSSLQEELEDILRGR